MNGNAPELDAAETPEEIGLPLYSCEYAMNGDFFSEFSAVSYIKAKIFIIIFTVLNILFSLFNIIVGNYNTAAGYSVIITFLMYIMYFRIKKGVQLSYKRSLFSYGNDAKTTTELFEDKILSTFSKNEKKFFYYQISGLFETGNLILLRLQFNLYLAVDKNSLNADPQAVKEFLIQKCPAVKKKKFTDCSNSRRLSLIFLMISTAASAAALLVCLLFIKNSI